MAYAAGVDVGSTQTKAVVVDETGGIVARALTDTGANVVQAAQSASSAGIQIDLMRAPWRRGGCGWGRRGSGGSSWDGSRGGTRGSG